MCLLLVDNCHSFGIGTALVNSGVAGGIAEFLVNVGDALGIGGWYYVWCRDAMIWVLLSWWLILSLHSPYLLDAGLLGAVYFATFLISNIVTNNAAAALIFPVALDAAEQTGIDRVIMSYCVMLGASARYDYGLRNISHNVMVDIVRFSNLRSLISICYPILFLQLHVALWLYNELAHLWSRWIQST